MNSKASQRRLMLGGGTALGVIIFLAILVGVQYVVLQHPKRWDLTQTGRYTLAPQSKKILQTFKEKKLPIEVLAFYETKDSSERDKVRDLLEQYRDVYSDFSYSFIDPDKDRAVAIKNKIDTYPTIVIKSGEKDERITTADEETFTNALLKLLRTEVKKVYFLKGHGELSTSVSEPEGMSTAKEQIEKQNYQTAETVLLQEAGVPQDAAMLIIAGPRTDLMDSELDSIREYIKRGGKLLVELNPFKSPKLCALLKEYGFETADDIVVDRMSRALGGDYLMPVITTYVNFPITKNFTLASFFPEARSVRASKTPIPHVTVKELAMTSPVSWTISEEQLKAGDANFDEKKGTKGPVPVMAVSTCENIAAASTKPGEEKVKADNPSEEAKPALKKNGEAKTGGDENETPQKPPKARIVVFGSAQFAANKFFNLQGNGELFMNTVSWLAEEENLIAIRPKSSRAEPLVLTGSQSVLTLVIPVVIIPLAWFIIGIAIYWYRKRTASA